MFAVAVKRDHERDTKEDNISGRQIWTPAFKLLEISPDQYTLFFLYLLDTPLCWYYIIASSFQGESHQISPVCFIHQPFCSSSPS